MGVDQMNRRDFVLRLAGGCAAVPLTLKLVACGEDDNNNNSNNNNSNSCSTVSSQIENNHGHTLIVSIADITAGAQKSFDITGSSAHPHEITLTAAHFATLAGGGSVTVDSTTDASHSHEVVVSCA